MASGTDPHNLQSFLDAQASVIDRVRDPVILEPRDFEAWLNGTLGPKALKCASENALRSWPVSRRMNRTAEGDDDPTIIEPLCTSAGGAGFLDKKGSAHKPVSSVHRMGAMMLSIVCWAIATDLISEKSSRLR